VCDEFGNKILSVIKSQGLLPTIGVIQGLNNIDNSKKQKAQKKIATEFFHEQFTTKSRILPLDDEKDAHQFVRFLCETKVSQLSWRNIRPYMLVDKLDYKSYDDMEGPADFGTLSISGYLRGFYLNPNNVVHITGYGDALISKIERGADPYSIRHKSKTEEPESDTQITLPDKEQENLTRENPPDPFAAEQTWPTQEEIELASKGIELKKRVPAGYSAYQAAWILDDGDGDEAQDEDEDENEDDSDIEMKTIDDNTQKKDTVIKDLEEPGNLKKSTEMIPVASKSGTATPNDISLEDEESDEEVDEEMKPKDKENNEEEEDMVWPDEVELSPDVLARERYQKFRGLKSFRTSPWDPKENLPRDYSRIFQFQNFNRTYKRIIKETKGVAHEQYITIHLKNIHVKQFESHPKNRPLVISGLFKYENKISVINFKITKHPTYTTTVKSKTPMEIHAGFRRWKASPIFSENTMFSKFKYLRFLRGTVIASMYGPICFPSMPVICLDESQEFLAYGSLLSVNTERIILKKLVFTGHPMKVSGSKAIVRHMFYNPDDVNWFKPVELWTKYGRSGNILEPVATKGRFKGKFDSHLHNHDTVCMSLYKRIYPKWAELTDLTQPPSETTEGDHHINKIDD